MNTTARRRKNTVIVLLFVIEALVGLAIGSALPGTRAKGDGLYYAVQLRECGWDVAWVVISQGRAQIVCAPVEFK